jgi:hypothetical protein
VHAAIEMFTGNQVRAVDVQNLIDRPLNAINLHADPRISMDETLAWGIEARSVGNEVRLIRLCDADPDIT